MTSGHEQVSAALRAVAFSGATRYVWLGRAREAVASPLDSRERRARLVGTLTAQLYASFYCAGSPLPGFRGADGPLAADPSLARALSEANTGQGTWERGWTLERRDGDRVVLNGPRLRISAPLSRCRGDVSRPGNPVSLRVEKDQPLLSPGFHAVVGDATNAGDGLRVYWNVAPSGAPDLMRALTTRLNDARVPFRLKIANHPARFGRCDVAVLYLDADAYQDQRATLMEMATGLGARLRTPTPALTLRLGPGLAAAEDPPGGESFGVHRCGLLAEGIVRAHEARATRLTARLEVVQTCFAEAGVDLEAPYRSGRGAL